MKIHWT
jgi:hypothetical protein